VNDIPDREIRGPEGKPGVLPVSDLPLRAAADAVVQIRLISHYAVSMHIV